MALPAAAIPIATKIAAEVFPHIVRRFGGPNGPDVAEQVIRVVSSAASVPKGADVQTVLASLREDEAKMAAARVQLEQLDQQAYAAEISDRDSARRYQAGLNQQGRVRGNLMIVGAAAAVLSCVWGVTQQELSQSADIMLSTVTGWALKMLSDVFAFEFGSSRGSKEKSEIIQKMQSEIRQSSVAARIKPSSSPAASVSAVEVQRPSGDSGAAVSVSPASRDFVQELREAPR